MKKTSLDIHRPYLVIPKLVVQPTWGGTYIVETKGWLDRPGHDVKIGQSYELFSGSNLSLLDSSDDPAFEGELADRDTAQLQTTPENSIMLAELTDVYPESVLGKSVVKERGPTIQLLIKFTQALGNSFQVHIRDGVTHPKWKPKPESWYYFEPGLVTFGIKPDADWGEYESTVRAVHEEMQKISHDVKAEHISFHAAKNRIAELLTKHNPWDYVNTVAVNKDQVVNLSEGGIHHSWEEDSKQAPLGNVLLELQGEAMDDVSTFRNFDKGKMEPDGSIRDVHIDTYFDVIDRNPKTNDPESHIVEFKTIETGNNYQFDELMRSRHYNMDKLSLTGKNAKYSVMIDQYHHLFVKSGKILVVGGATQLTVGAGHSCFVPAAVGQYDVVCMSDQSEVLINY